MSKFFSAIFVISGIILMILSLIGYLIDSNDISNVFTLVMAFGLWTMERLIPLDNRSRK